MNRLLILMACVLWIPTVGAHGFGQSLEKNIGPYLVDAGYDQPQFTPGEPVLWNFGLIEGAGTLNWKIAPYDQVEAKFFHNEQLLKEKTTTLGVPLLAYMSFTFPETGKYTLALRFLKEGSVLAETTFPIVVTDGGTPILAMLIAVAAVIAFAAGLSALILLPALKKRKQ